MCQYSAVEGVPNSWHRTHLGQYAIGRAGLVITPRTTSPGWSQILGTLPQEALPQALMRSKYTPPTVTSSTDSSHRCLTTEQTPMAACLRIEYVWCWRLLMRSETPSQTLCRCLFASPPPSLRLGEKRFRYGAIIETPNFLVLACVRPASWHRKPGGPFATLATSQKKGKGLPLVRSRG